MAAFTVHSRHERAPLLTGGEHNGWDGRCRGRAAWVTLSHSMTKHRFISRSYNQPRAQPGNNKATSSLNWSVCPLFQAQKTCPLIVKIHCWLINIEYLIFFLIALCNGKVTRYAEYMVTLIEVEQETCLYYICTGIEVLHESVAYICTPFQEYFEANCAFFSQESKTLVSLQIYPFVLILPRMLLGHSFSPIFTKFGGEFSPPLSHMNLWLCPKVFLEILSFASEGGYYMCR